MLKKFAAIVLVSSILFAPIVLAPTVAMAQVGKDPSPGQKTPKQKYQAEAKKKAEARHELCINTVHSDKTLDDQALMNAIAKCESKVPPEQSHGVPHNPKAHEYHR